MAAKIVPNTNSRGITPAPKLAANPTIQSRTASVKIVLNTALFLSGWLLQKILQLSLRLYGPERSLLVMGYGSARFRYVWYRAYSSDPL
jgi:hypothetical protein